MPLRQFLPSGKELNVHIKLVLYVIKITRQTTDVNIRRSVVTVEIQRASIKPIVEVTANKHSTNAHLVPISINYLVYILGGYRPQTPVKKEL